MRRIVLAVLALLLVATAGGSAYFAIPQPELPEAVAARASTPTVTFGHEDDRLVFTPAPATAGDGGPSVGLVIYPGGKVSAGAYAPLAAAIAARGYLVEIVPMPLNLAVLGVDRAGAVIAAHPEIAAWAIGGHSLGGAMAAQYAHDDPRIDGLALWASYSATDLSSRDLDVIIVYGTLDAGAAGFVAAERLALLPADPEIFVIPGGNHEQMGWYTGQPNDPPATIGRAAQQAVVIDATVALLERLGAEPTGAGISWAAGSIRP